jgi:hypothetical protein
MPGDSGVTCMLVCAFCHFLHTRPRAHRPPGIPCALCLEGEKINEYLAKKAFGEIAKSCLNVIARSTFVRRSPPSGEGGCDEAIHLSACRTMDCFAALAMTVLGRSLASYSTSSRRRPGPITPNVRCCDARRREATNTAVPRNFTAYGSRPSPGRQGASRSPSARSPPRRSSP